MGKLLLGGERNIEELQKDKEKIVSDDGCNLDKPNYNREKLLKTVLKKAKGYTVKEYVDEYSMVDGQLTLIKRKVSVKDVPPDTNAIKIILDGTEEKKSVTLAELESERQALIELFKGEMYGTDKDEL